MQHFIITTVQPAIFNILDKFVFNQLNDFMIFTFFLIIFENTNVVLDPIVTLRLQLLR